MTERVIRIVMMTRANTIGAVMGFALIVASVPFWITYMGHGFAYGAWVGMPGKETAPIETGNLATQALRRAMAIEGCGLTVAIWSVMARYHAFPSGNIVRLIAAILGAAFLTFATLAFVRGV